MVFFPSFPFFFMLLNFPSPPLSSSARLVSYLAAKSRTVENRRKAVRPTGRRREKERERDTDRQTRQARHATEAAVKTRVQIEQLHPSRAHL
ncbi:hypothetical protein F4809DRAFT_495527 [Biscogniauxia mediterranea]|nr:hypothetical protein F4809DRAFT_495527 [Biscogniauxia mediterranea]